MKNAVVGSDGRYKCYARCDIETQRDRMKKRVDEGAASKFKKRRCPRHAPKRS
jgi:hypothetical protein